LYIENRHCTLINLSILNATFMEKYKIKDLQSLGQFCINNQKIQDTIKNKSCSWRNGDKN
jgi:hypothetical protein